MTSGATSPPGGGPPSKDSPRVNRFYQRARFLLSAPALAHLPPDSGREVAFAGRSNAGKSSAINALCYQNQLARTSKTPGRTQQLVVFALDDEHRLVDLPGYGYAKVPLTMKRQWQAVMAEYLNQRQSLAGLVLVMDIRHPLTDYDEQMIQWAGPARLPLLLLLTKSDKLAAGAARKQLAEVRRAVVGEGERVSVELFSATTRVGVEAVHLVLDRWLGV